MKRFRVKAIGLGLALAAGGAATGSEWGAPAGAPKPEAGTLWLPARQPAPAPAVAPSPVAPAGGYPQPAPRPEPPNAVAASAPVAPQAQPQSAPQSVSVSVGPRAAGPTDPFGPLPPIPVPLPPAFTATPAPAEAPAVQPDIPRPLPMAKPPEAAGARPDPLVIPKPLEAPQPVDPPMPKSEPMMTPPRPPGDLSAPLPQPRPVNPAPDARPLPQPDELPCAPADVIYSPGALGIDKHAIFGSPPIRLSRDYPPLRDLIAHNRLHDDITIAPDGTAGGPGAGFNRYFVSGEYLLWWMPGYPVPVLATSNANTALNGFFGEPGTTAIVGPGPFVGSTRSGFRVRAGAWLDDCGSCGIDAGFFLLGPLSSASTVGSSAFPLITRPVFVPNPLPGTGAPLGENGEYVALPGALRGTLTARGDSFLWGADVNLRKSLRGACDTRAEVFAGYRHLNLREGLTVTENITVVGASPRLAAADPIGTQVLVQDRFRTLNSFNGGQVGALYGRQLGRFDVTGRASVALGATHQSLDIEGFQIRQQPGLAPMSYRGGLLAAGPNLGHFTRDRFSVAPELTLNLGYRVTPNLRVFAGYNFLVWTNVIRPGDQIDRVVDVTFVPNAPPAPFSGQARPHPLFAERDLVIQGIQFGVDLRW